MGKEEEKGEKARVRREEKEKPAKTCVMSVDWKSSEELTHRGVHNIHVHETWYCEELTHRGMYNIHGHETRCCEERTFRAIYNTHGQETQYC